jgi:UDP-N-acetylmuramoylalanine--D-glutamate ligase
MTDRDLLIYPLNFPLIAKWWITQSARKRIIDIEHFDISYDLSKFKLPGIHNKINLLFILKVAEELKLDPAAVQTSIDTFCGVHHRIEFVEGVHGFSAFNDGKSTNWDATITAVNAMEKKEKKLYLIIGGKKRGHGDSILPILPVLLKNVDRLYLVGEMSDEIEAEIRKKIEYKKLLTLDATISDIRGENFEGIVLFSPGFPSFDQYLNYEKRGEDFVSLVKKN